jgi:hypothetical protein
MRQRIASLAARTLALAIVNVEFYRSSMDSHVVESIRIDRDS